MSTKFDLDAYLQSLEPPILVIGGKEYKGRVLSILEFAQFQDQIAKLSESPETFKSFASDFLYALFPKNRLIPWVDPVAVVLNSPGLQQVVESFLDLTIRNLKLNQKKTESSSD